jgi:hypothetical protein
MASFDLSAPFRQGMFLIGKPKQFAPAFGEMFKYFGSEKAYRALAQEITSRSTHKLMRQGKLAITELDNVLKLREERFMSHWAEKIPVVRASGRAYSGFLNKLRADVFDDLIRQAETQKLDPANNPTLVKQIANFVNAGTGRGSLGALERSAVILNTAFFSPRLMASRFQLLNYLNPVHLAKLDPFVRKQALKSWLSFTSVGMTMIGIAKLGGMDIGSNLTSSDFGKAIKGKTRLDVWGGLQQYVRTAAQLIAGKSTSPTTGKVTKERNRLPTLARFFEYKEAPVVSFATDFLRGKTAFGEPFSLKSAAAQRFIPMIMQDVIDIAKDDPDLVPLSALGVFGMGLQTYERKQKPISKTFWR